MRAIYRRHSDGVLFAMDYDVDFRLGHCVAEYEKVTDGNFEKGRTRAPNGHSCRVYAGNNSKRYHVYADGSASDAGVKNG